jgi:hypothetical protein
MASKTIAELTTEARSLINEPDSTNSHITDSQFYIWGNEAYRYILTKTKDIPKKENTLTTATGDIATSANTLTIDEAYMYNPVSGKYVPLQVIDLSYLQFINPSWLSEDAGEPKYFVRKDTFNVYLFPQPDTAFLAQNIKTYGMEFPATMSSASDGPDKLPLNLQDSMPHYMAYRAFSQLSMHDKAGMELELFRSMVKGQIDISTVGSNSAQIWRVTDSMDDE